MQCLVLLFLAGIALAELEVRYSPPASSRNAASQGSNAQSRLDQRDDVDSTLKQCCKAYGMKSECVEKMCSYETTDGELYCYAPDCHNDLKRWVYCASDDQDNTNCCRDQGLPEQCLQFCRGGTPLLSELFRSDFHYLPCLGGISKILECNKAGVVERGGHKNVCLDDKGFKCLSAKSKFVDESSSQYEGIFNVLRNSC